MRPAGKLPRSIVDLTGISDEAVMQASFESANPENREDAVEMLRQSGHPDGIAKLSVALTDENIDVREAAIDALADIGGDEAAQAGMHNDGTIAGLGESAIPVSFVVCVRPHNSLSCLIPTTPSIRRPDHTGLTAVRVSLAAFLIETQ